MKTWCINRNAAVALAVGLAFIAVDILNANPQEKNSVDNAVAATEILTETNKAGMSLENLSALAFDANAVMARQGKGGWFKAKGHDAEQNAVAVTAASPKLVAVVQKAVDKLTPEQKEKLYAEAEKEISKIVAKPEISAPSEQIQEGFRAKLAALAGKIPDMGSKFLFNWILGAVCILVGAMLAVTAAQTGVPIPASGTLIIAGIILGLKGRK